MQIHFTGVGGRRAALRILVGLTAGLVTAVPLLSLGQPVSRFSAATAVAVAPFVNISAAPSDDWIGAGIAETVSADLERLDEVSVVGRETLADEISAAGLDAGTRDAEHIVREASRRLGAAWLVTGGYQRLGDQMRITARLVDTGTGVVAAGVRVDGVFGDLFALQDQVVHELDAAFDAAVNGGAYPAANGNGNGNGNGKRCVRRRRAVAWVGAQPSAAGRGGAARERDLPPAGRGGRSAKRAAAACRRRHRQRSAGGSARGGQRQTRFRRARRRRGHSDRTSDAAADAHGSPPRHRRPPRRRGLAERVARHRVRPGVAARGRAGNRGHRGLDQLRQPEPVRGGARALRGSRHHAGDPGGSRPVVARRQHHRLLRPVPRPAAGLRSLGQRLQRAGRRDHQRARPQRPRRRWPRRRRWRRRRRLQTLGNSVRRPVVGRAVRQRRADRRRRLHGRDGDSVQEPALSAAGPRRAAPLGVPDRPRDPAQGRERGLGADLARGVRLPAADGAARGDDEPLDEPQSRDHAGGDRHPARLARHVDRVLRGGQGAAGRRASTSSTASRRT